MVASILLASCLSFGGFPEVPVGPVTPVAQVDSSQQVSPPAPDLPLDEDTWDEGDQAARARAEHDRAVREANERAAQLAPEPIDDELAKARHAKGPRPFEVRVLATTTLPMRIARVPSSGDLLVGLRGELDIGHASALFSWDRGAASIFNWRDSLTPTSYWNGLIGPTVWATRHSRIRLLAGLSAVSTSQAYASVSSGSIVTSGAVATRRSGVQFGPTLGATVHLGIPVLSLEGAVLYTPVSFQQVDARAEVVLRLLILELRGGYRARWIDTSRSTTQVPVEPVYGPTFSVGLAF